jgi:hypothetical protein
MGRGLHYQNIIFAIILASPIFRALANDPAGTVDSSEFVKLIENSGGEVPYPYTKFLNIFTADPKDDNPSVGNSVVPDGRSLVKTFSSYDSPRFVSQLIPSTGPSGPTFVGYAQRSNEMEVISWNEKNQNYDFFLVKNYKTGAKPQIERPDQKLCTTCHQNGGPLWARGQWFESSPNFFANKLRLSPELTKIETEKGFAFDLGIRQANDLLQSKRACRTACGSDLSCRQKVLLGSIENMVLADQSPATRESLRQSIQRSVQPHWPQDGFSYPSDVLPDRNPLVDSKHGGVAVREQITDLPAFIKALQVNAGLDPIAATPDNVARVEAEYRQGIEFTYNHDNPDAILPAGGASFMKEIQIPCDNPKSGCDPAVPRPKVGAIAHQNAGAYLMTNCFQFSNEDLNLLSEIPYEKMQEVIQDRSTRSFLTTWPRSESEVMQYLRSKLIFSEPFHFPRVSLTCQDQTSAAQPIPSKTKVSVIFMSQIASRVRPKGALEIYDHYCGRCHVGSQALIKNLNIRSISDLKNYKDSLGETLIDKIKSNKMPFDLRYYSPPEAEHWREDRQLLLKTLQDE